MLCISKQYVLDIPIPADVADIADGVRQGVAYDNMSFKDRRSSMSFGRDEKCYISSVLLRKRS